MLQSRHRVAEWIRKQDLYTCCLQRPPLNKGHTQTKSKRMEKILHANGKGKKPGVAILISDEIDFKTKAI